MYEVDVACRIELPKLKKAAKQIVAKKANSKETETTFQGELLTLLGEEESDISWKAIIYSVPRGVMFWAVCSCTNSLATADNLARWGKILHPKCHMCGCTDTATLGHLLSTSKLWKTRGDTHIDMIHFSTSYTRL